MITRGPWTRGGNVMDGYSVLTFRFSEQAKLMDNGGLPICQCRGPDAYANAQAISALPVMAAALREFVDKFDPREWHLAFAYADALEALKRMEGRK